MSVCVPTHCSKMFSSFMTGGGSSISINGWKITTKGRHVIVNGVDVTNFVRSGGVPGAASAAPDVDAFKGSRELTVSAPVDSLVVNTVMESEVVIRVLDGGSIRNLTAEDGTVTVHGDVKGKVATSSGDVDVKGGCHGDISTMSGDVDILGSVTGNASTMSGDIRAGSVAGKKSTMSGRIKKGGAGAGSGAGSGAGGVGTKKRRVRK